MNDLERPSFFHHAIESATVVTGFGFPALLVDLLADIHPPQVVYPRSTQLLQKCSALIIVKENPGAILTDILQYRYSRSEVSDMKSR